MTLKYAEVIATPSIASSGTYYYHTIITHLKKAIPARFFPTGGVTKLLMAYFTHDATENARRSLATLGKRRLFNTCLKLCIKAILLNYILSYTGFYVDLYRIVTALFLFSANVQVECVKERSISTHWAGVAQQSQFCQIPTFKKYLWSSYTLFLPGT